jgi:hypothetical protein
MHPSPQNPDAGRAEPPPLSGPAWAAVEHVRAVRLLADELDGDAAYRMRVGADAAALEELIVRRGAAGGEP